MKRFAILCVLATVCGCGRSHDGYTDESLVARITAMEKRIGQTESSLGYINHVQDVILQANSKSAYQAARDPSAPPVSYCGPPPMNELQEIGRSEAIKADVNFLKYRIEKLEKELHDLKDHLSPPRIGDHDEYDWQEPPPMNELQELRIRVKQQDEELTRLRKLRKRLMDLHLEFFPPC